MPRKAKHIRDIRSYARQYTDLAINTLVGIASSEEASDRARATAAQALLDRGWGKPAQTVDMTVEVNPLESLYDKVKNKSRDLPTQH